jgi:hypothetical protein
MSYQVKHDVLNIFNFPNIFLGVKRFLGAEFKSEYFEKESMYYPDLEFSKDPQNDSVLIKLTFPNTENPDGPLKEVYKKPQV